MKKIVIYGGGGHCYALVELIKICSDFEPILIIDKNPSKISILGVPVQQGNIEKTNQDAVAIAIGNNRIRKSLANSVAEYAPSFVHPSAVVYPSAVIGRGVQILPNAIVDASVTLGDFVLINNNASVSHNTVVESFCHIAINAAISGGCSIGEGSLIGAGSVLLPGVKIGAWATIGAGAVVTQDVPDGATVVGSPARIIKK